MKIVIAKIRRNNNVGGYELWDEDGLLGTFIPGTEFIFEDFVNCEVRIEVKDTKEKEEGWKIVQHGGLYKMEELERKGKNLRSLRIHSCGMKHDYDLLGICNKCGKKRGEE